eukprot:s679_g31.t1
MTDARTDDQILASAETHLRFIMDDVGVPTDGQVKLYKKGFISLPIFTGMDETRAEVRQALAKEIPLATRADAKLGVQDRLVQVTEYAAICGAEDNSPHVEDLRDVTSVEDAEAESYAAVIDPSSASCLCFKPGCTLTTPPCTPEELRLRRRRIGLAWHMVRTKHATRSWLLESVVDSFRLSDHVLGDRAELRRHVYKFIRTGEAKDIGVAIDKGCRAPDLLAVHLVTPFSLGAFVLQGAVAVPPTTLALTDFPHVPPPPEATFQRPGKGASKTGGKAEASVDAGYGEDEDGFQKAGRGHVRIAFTFSRDGDEVHLSGLAVAREESKEGKVVKPKAKAKVKAKAKSKKEGKYDEFGRRIDKLKKKELSSSDEDLDDFCPSSKKNADFERELRRMKKKVREGMTEQQREEMENPWLHTQISDQERELKKQMFRSFYQEQYARLKNKAQPDYKQYEKSDPTTGQSTTGGNLTAEGGHRPLPRPKGVKLPADFRKQVGRISQKELLEKHSCKGQRMLISVYGDLFDVSDRPDKYGPDGPYWYMTGKDITWALMSGEDTEETMDKFYDVFKIQPAEAADRRLQGLMSWWAFYEKEYGKPVGRNTAYDKEWGLPAPPHMADGCSVM